MHSIEEMTKEERSLLLYLESRATDHGGLVAVRNRNRGLPIMNEIDMEIAQRWNDEGFILFGRLSMESINALTDSTHWCELSEEAWSLAHQERRARYRRINSKRHWLKTEEI